MERLRNFKAEAARKCAKTVFMLNFQQEEPRK